MKFKLRKMSVPENPHHPTSEDWDIETNGWLNETVSPWVGYEVEGVGEDLPEVGKAFCMVRTKRNGEDILGFFHTSRVEKVVGDEESPYIMVETMNSVYRLEVE